ncbi:MAG: DNA topoisomerase IV [Flavobacteriaceae bacterium]
MMVVIKKISSLSILLFTILFFHSCNQIERNCNLFKTGEFFSEINYDGVLFSSTFSRDDKNIQIEKFQDKIDSSKVRWINDCEMVLSPINAKKLSGKKNILIKILTTTDTSYSYEYSFIGENKKLKAVAIKIN